MSKKNTTKSKKIPAEQQKSKVGYKNPPKECQFKPGESGNPDGPSARRTNLWVWFCKYMTMTDRQLQKLNSKKLTQIQQTALKLVENAKHGKHSGSDRLAYHVFEREEGKARQEVNIEGEVPVRRELSAEEIRDLLQDEVLDCDDAIAS
jgi:hypothetical protein